MPDDIPEEYVLKDAIDLRLAYGLSHREIQNGEKLVKFSLPWDLEGFKKLDMDQKNSRSNMCVSKNETRFTAESSAPRIFSPLTSIPEPGETKIQFQDRKAQSSLEKTRPLPKGFVKTS